MSISFTSPDITVNEDDGVVQVCVASNHSIETTVIIIVGTKAGTAECEFGEIIQTKSLAFSCLYVLGACSDCLDRIHTR